LGEGGAGRVMRARQTAGGADVAIKVLAAGPEAQDPAAAARFAREIESLKSLRHPNIVELLDHGLDEKLGPFVVMPLVEGQTLRVLLERERTVLPEVAWAIVAEIADALAFVHAHGWVHRDVKPENVMIGSDGRITLLDFGLALAEKRSRHTTPGMIAGSIPYMAPEPIEGKEVGPSCDVWSLAVVFWELLAGERPHQRAGMQEEVAAILAGARVHAKKLGRGRVAANIADLLERCLSLEPTKRPTAEEIATIARRAVGADSKEAIAAELALFLAAPSPYRARTAARRAAEQIAVAKERLATGDAFGALEAIEIGLAYKPDDASLTELLAKASAAPPAPPAPAPTAVAVRTGDAAAPPKRTIAIALAAALGLFALGAGGVGYAMWTRLPTSSRAAHEPAASDVRSSAPSAVASSSASPPAAPGLNEPRMPFPEVPPLVLSELSNTDTPKPKPVPKPGEPILPRDMFQSPGPEGWLAEYEATLKKNPDDIPSHLGKALALLALGKTDAGLAVLDETEKRFPKDALVVSTRGVVAGKTGDLEGAEKLFARAVELDPKEASNWRNLGITRSQRGKTRDAYVALLEALNRDQDDLEAIKELAAIYGRTGKTQDGAPLVRRIAQKTPRDPNVWVDLSIAEADIEKSLDAVRRALALAPELPRAHVRLCVALSKKKAPEAVGACTRALELSPKNEDVYNARGLAHFAAGNDTAAITDLDEAIRLAPKVGIHYKNRYIVRSHAGKLAEAKSDLTKACELGEKEACDELAKN
ncbi:MAG: protein kinase, partial [Polyangiaceae bacterium]|nr:protein kinase [Polyangiaceae bacterium]